MTAPEVPPGVPSLLKLGNVARALNVPERMVRGWLERKTLPYVQASGKRGNRLIPARALAVFADEKGIALDWLQAM